MLNRIIELGSGMGVAVMFIESDVFAPPIKAKPELLELVSTTLFKTRATLVTFIPDRSKDRLPLQSPD